MIDSDATQRRALDKRSCHPMYGENHLAYIGLPRVHAAHCIRDARGLN